MFHCRTRIPVSFVTNDDIDHMCSTISNPDFLLQKPFAHGTESCIKISVFLKSFAEFIFLLQKGGWVYCITDNMTVYKRVNSRSHDNIFRMS